MTTGGLDPFIPASEKLERRSHASLERQLAEIKATLDRFAQAFPVDEYGNVDSAGHRQFHESKIAAAEAERVFWQELKLDLAKKGLYAILTVLVGFIIAGLMAKINGAR